MHIQIHVTTVLNGAHSVFFLLFQLKKLRSYVRTAHENGVTDAKLPSTQEILAMEPSVNSDMIKGGMIVPAEAMIDSNLVAVTLAHSALRQGSKVSMNSVGSEAKGSIYILKTVTG